MAMTMTLARRYSPSRAASLQPEILAALVDDEWRNITVICAKLNRSSDDGAVRYCLKMLVYAGRLERTIEARPQSRTGFRYLYRRRS